MEGTVYAVCQCIQAPYNLWCVTYHLMLVTVMGTESDL